MRNILLGTMALALVFVGPGVALALNDDGTENVPVSGGALPPAHPNATGDGSLTTIFAQNNGFSGNSFDITANTDLMVVGWDVNLDASPDPWTVEVWWRVGTADGFEQVAAGWNLLGSDSVIAAGADLPTHVNVGGLVMTSGETVGVIIASQPSPTGANGFNYTNGGPNTYSNADMDVTTYRGLDSGPPAGSIFTYRIWNGTVHYDYGPVGTDQASWGSIKVGYRD